MAFHAQNFCCMEKTLSTELFIEESKIDLNQIANHLINSLTNKITSQVLSGVKNILDNHFPEPQEEKTEYLTQKEAYKRLGISRSAFYQREKQGYLKRDGSNGRPLYSVKQIEEYLKKLDS